MTKLKFIIPGLLLISGIISCNVNSKESEKTAVSDLKSYVDSINNAHLEYSKDNWVAIDNGYQKRALKAEAQQAELSDEEKAELESSKASYAELKTKYQTELDKTNVIDPKIRLRNSLFGEGKVGEDMTFLFATSDNLLSIYQSFV